MSYSGNPIEDAIVEMNYQDRNLIEVRECCSCKNNFFHRGVRINDEYFCDPCQANYLHLEWYRDAFGWEPQQIDSYCEQYLEYL